jgi:tRNA (cytidine/uridine-2'-O-)-methyltransferase
MQIPLSIVGPIPFEISDRTVKRAGLDYWPWVTLHRYQTLDEFVMAHRPDTLWFIETHQGAPYYTARFKRGDALIFGSETIGIKPTILEQAPPSSRLYIPMACPHVRSLNLSNSVSLVLGEALRQVEWQPLLNG